MTLTDCGIAPVPAHAEWNRHEAVYELITDSGRRVTRNRDHPFWAGRAGRLNGRTPQLEVRGWTPLGDLGVGDLVAVAKHLPVQATGEMPEHEIKLLAYLIGDGGLTGGVVFSQMPGPQLDEFRECAATLGCELRPTTRPADFQVVRAGSSTRTRYRSSPIRSLLREHGMFPCHSRDKRVPDAIWGLRNDLVALFLNRLYSADGWAHTRPGGRGSEIGFCSASRQLVEDIQELLLRFGVCSRIDEKPQVNAWVVLLCGAEDRIAFADRVGIFGKEAAVAKVRQHAATRSKVQVWRSLKLPPELRWERVKSIESAGAERTVAITVPEHHTFLSTLWEHNTYYAPLWVWSRLIDPKAGTLKQGARGLALGRGYQIHIERVMLFELRRFLQDIGCGFHYNAQKQAISLPNDCQILFGSAENPSSLEGPHLNAFCWIDEGGLMPLLAWEVANRRTNKWEAPILVTTVPYFENWLKTEVYDRWVDGDPDIEWIECATADNLTYSKDAIERMRRTMRREKFEVFYLGRFAKPFGLIYKGIEDGDLLADPFMVPEHWPCYAGHDWGVNDPTTGVWGRWSPDGQLYVVAEYEHGGLTIEDHLRWWNECGLTAVDRAFGDPEGKELMMRAAQLGYPVIPAPNAVVDGIDLVYSWMKAGRLKVFRGCRMIIDYKNTYVWATDRKDEDRLLDKPKDPQAARHLMDGLRYLCTGIHQFGIDGTEPQLDVHRRTAREEAHLAVASPEQLQRLVSSAEP